MVASKLQEESLDRLFEAILELQNIEECYRFFEDLCTVAELKALGQRLQVAKMLEKDCTYTHIAEETGASPATISRVKRSLHYGADGYKLLLQRLREKKKLVDTV
ncbi:YerC/YecD family TrpR-related protein [Heliorestis convoluta]|uniref:Trpr-like protein yerc/yecd, putative n=1 Tax=Heliorestis convoluta TaxID=356322 RepID=A0A5Q2N9S7_9FIRM|nr:YerC/YecD family TrpR-related protein [Heliorestis convoluta]QGG49030.1 trpr-like protein yerc/yecd, putative [Heliorestis convoluta]